MAPSVREGGLIANRIQVGVLRRHVATALRHVDRLPEMLDRVGCSTGEALTAGDVVEELRLVGGRLDELAPPVRRLR